MVLSYEPLEVGCIVKTRTIGALLMEDEEGEDPKILTVPTTDLRFDGYGNLNDVHPHKLKEIQEFFEVYKRLEPKKHVTFKAWSEAPEARRTVCQALDLYKKNIHQKVTCLPSGLMELLLSVCVELGKKSAGRVAEQCSSLL
jgi:inorganic pyrophosphatase